MNASRHRSLVPLVLLPLLTCCEPDSAPGARGAPGPVPAKAGVPADAPRVRLRVSGNLAGYLMPCGCASGQMGGLARRLFRNKLDARNIDVFIEGGNLSKKAGELEFLKLYTALEVFAQGPTAYHAIGIAARDLTFDLEELGYLFESFPMVASDLVGTDGASWQTAAEKVEDRKPVAAPFREVKLDQAIVRIASLAMALPDGPANKTLKLLSPAEGWKRALHGAADTTYRVVLIHADRTRIETLRLRPKPDLIVAVNDDYVEPPPGASVADGVPLVFVGVHGRLLVDVTLVRGPDGPTLTHYAPIALRGSRTAKNAMRDKVALEIIRNHRLTVQEDGLLERLAGKQPTPSGAKYIGAQECAECHDTDAETCKPHAHTTAWHTLVEAGKRESWPVTSYPECVSCHVVGYGYRSGFVNPKETPQLLNVTCENCHGPGSAHATSQAGDGKAVSIPVPKPSPQTCTACHNFEHSPKFDFTGYWKKIVHGDK